MRIDVCIVREMFMHVHIMYAVCLYAMLIHLTESFICFHLFHDLFHPFHWSLWSLWSLSSLSWSRPSPMAVTAAVQGSRAILPSADERTCPQQATGRMCCHFKYLPGSVPFWGTSEATFTAFWKKNSNRIDSLSMQFSSRQFLSSLRLHILSIVDSQTMSPHTLAWPPPSRRTAISSYSHWVQKRCFCLEDVWMNVEWGMSSHLFF